jgi:phosphatidylglycerophosphate synthase
MQMKPVNSALDAGRSLVRKLMRAIARALNTISGGKLSPNLVTFTGLVMHLPLSYLIARSYFGYAALGLVVFGLFDALDGELARLQGRAGNRGMLLDATTDRMKEVLLYSGAAYALIDRGQAYFATWAVLACGGSLLVSYVKAKGETAVAGGNLTANEVNRLFQDGFMRFEIRMLALVIGLLTSQLAGALIVIAILSWLTAFGRLIKISGKLS